ncbi:fungal-specific transcription factor domain-containing protein [Mycena crocata]|nr:fungal-specific transcription factor domain-containing protein [Mycena crocata]
MSETTHPAVPRRTKRPSERKPKCDLCRTKKIRCVQDPSGAKCLPCQEADVRCTYLTAASKREGVPPSYVKSLETRLEDSLAVISELRKDLAAAYLNPPAAGSSLSVSSSNSAETPDPENRESETPEKDDTDTLDGLGACLALLRADLQNLPSPPKADEEQHLQALMPGYKFLGSSSDALLVRISSELKATAQGGGDPANPAHTQHIDYVTAWQDSFTICKQSHYWTGKSRDVLERSDAEIRPTYTFPPPALLSELIDLYFVHSDVYVPILHRPTFERDVATWLHLKDDAFAATVLLVCAIASRWSDDPRATGIPSGPKSPSGTDQLACGWQWYDQVPPQKMHLFGGVTLHGLQYYCLVARFFEGSNATERCWTLISVGLRLAQDVGAHRRQGPAEKPSVERELWKRAFWSLVYMDRMASAIMGRTCMVDSFDIDTDLLIEVDEEYWEHPTHPFQQPLGVPARVAFFNTLMRLNHILAACLKSLYSRTKIREVFNLKAGWETGVVAELDLALNNWFDSIPEHLRWDPARADSVFFDQSVALHCAYYYVQILATAQVQPSFGIDAARACADMVDIQRRRKGKVSVIINAHMMFISGLVLLLKNIKERRLGLVPDTARDIADVQKCCEVLRLCEDRWQAAGIYWDILVEVMSFTTIGNELGIGGKLSPARMASISRNPGIFGVVPIEPSTVVFD